MTVNINIKDKLESFIERTISGLGFEFVGMQWISGSNRPILRVFADKIDGHINIDECATISRHLSRVLDVEDIINTKYLLEVSSPGLDRILFKLKDYKKFIGKSVKVLLKETIDNKKRLQGEIIKVDEDAQQITILLLDGNEFIINFADIKTANLVPEINFRG